MKLLSIVAVLASVAAMPAVFAAPTINGAAIESVSGEDADSDGYYESVRFNLKLNASAEEGSAYEVKTRIFCTTTGHSWETDQWTLSGASIAEVAFDESDFAVSARQDLQFRVELWGAAPETKFAETSSISGAPVKIEPLPLDAPPAPLLKALSPTAAQLSITAGSLPEGCTYAIQCVSTTPADDRWAGKYLLPGGSAQAFDTPVWRYPDGLQNIIVEDLSPGITYAFAAKARYNGSESPLSGTVVFSSTIRAPGQPTVLGVSGGKIAMKLDPNGNSDGVVFAVQCTASSPLDSGFSERWLDRQGRPSLTPVWATVAEWAGLRAVGLQEQTEYSFAAAASLTGDGEPVFGPVVTAKTTISGDVNGDCKVSILDLVAIRNALHADASYSAAWLLADINDDGEINVIDMIFCRNRLYSSCD